MKVENLRYGVAGTPVAEAFSLMVQTIAVAEKSICSLLFLIGSIHNNADVLTDLLEAEKRFPFSDLNKVSSPDAECKDNSDAEDDSDDDEDADVGDDSDNDAEESSGEEDDDDEQGGPDSDSDANGDEDDDDDDEDDDDEDDDDDEEDDDDEDDEEEENQPPFKKKKLFNANSSLQETKKRKQYKDRNDVWFHFTKRTVDGVCRAYCKHCPISYSRECKFSTSNMRNHIPKCAGNPMNPKSDGESSTSVSFDQKNGRRAVVKRIIIDGLPFSFVDNEGFRRFMKICQPHFVIPSRRTIIRDCYQLYVDVKAKLKAHFKKSNPRVCLTTETWISLQQVNYMCLTAHYVDEDWKLQKKMLNFCPISSHQGSDIGRAVESCLNEWELHNVLTYTVDNASSNTNDLAVEYLVSKMVKWGDGCILKGKWTHVRCIAHIVNLIVQDALKELGTSVDRIRGAVQWVRLSDERLKRFKEVALLEKVECQKSLCLDDPTRWNSTYLMLSVACEYERAFDRFIDKDYEFSSDLIDGCGKPESTDWANAKRLGGFLHHFYELTVRVSGTKYNTSNTYLDSISCVDTILKQCALSVDEDLRNMSTTMIGKFNKYWGDVKKFNLLVFIASLFDPRTKVDYLKITLQGMYGVDIGDEVCKLCEDALRELFNDYKRIYSDAYVKKVPTSSSKCTNEEENMASGSEGFSLFGNDDTLRAHREKNMAEVKRLEAELGVVKDSKSELDRYLNEEIEGDDVWFESPYFSVLGWWKVRSKAFPILSLVARDILAIPISTVASESTFSMGGRVLDEFRSSLTPSIVEALICCQNWIRSSEVGNVEEWSEELDVFDEVGDVEESSGEDDDEDDDEQGGAESDSDANDDEEDDDDEDDEDDEDGEEVNQFV